MDNNLGDQSGLDESGNSELLLLNSSTVPSSRGTSPETLGGNEVAIPYNGRSLWHIFAEGIWPGLNWKAAVVNRVDNCFLIIKERGVKLRDWTFQFFLRHQKKLLIALTENQITAGICVETISSAQPNCLTFDDWKQVAQEALSSREDIRERWQLCPPETKKFQIPPKSKPKTLICSRPLFVERSSSRLTQNGRESPTELEDDDFDSVSTTSGIFTPCSTIGTHQDQAKSNALEQKLAILQRQVDQLLSQQGQNSRMAAAAVVDKPGPSNPPPPAPPLPPSLKAEIMKAATKSRQDASQSKPKPPTPPPLQTESTAASGMLDMLKDIGNIKLRKVNRDSPGKTRAKKQLENDGSLAGALARALGERRKKLKLDSEDGDGEQQQPGDSATDGWSDEEKENGGGGKEEHGQEEEEEEEEVFLMEGTSSI